MTLIGLQSVIKAASYGDLARYIDVEAGGLVDSQVVAQSAPKEVARASQVPRTGLEAASRLTHLAVDEYDSAHKRVRGHNGKSIRFGQGAFDRVELHRDIRLGRERWVVSKQPNPEVQQDLAQELSLNEMCCKHTNVLNVLGWVGKA